MKKIVSICLILVLALSLAACSGGPDVSALKDSFNALADEYNAMIAIAAENGWDQDAATVEGLNGIAETVSQVKTVIEDPSDYTQEQIDEMKNKCEDFRGWITEMAEVVSEPYTAG